MRALNSHGQALVETALLMPVLFLTAIVFLYVFLLCRQLLKLQPAAVDMAMLAATSEDPLAIRALQTRWLADTMEGRATPVVTTRDTTLIQEWKPASGASTVQDHGRLFSVEMAQRLIPHLVGAGWIPSLLFTCVAAMPAEPAIPEEE
jgi:hypothetical protein